MQQTKKHKNTSILYASESIGLFWPSMVNAMHVNGLRMTLLISEVMKFREKSNVSSRRTPGP